MGPSLLQIGRQCLSEVCIPTIPLIVTLVNVLASFTDRDKELDDNRQTSEGEIKETLETE